MAASVVNYWAVGTDINSSRGFLSEALHWNGKKWSLWPTPDPAGTTTGDRSTLWNVRCPSKADCWAVGDGFPFGKHDQNQAVHWNGRKWTIG